jgi:hypothetical protein
VAFETIPSWLWARVISAVFSGITILCMTLEIRRDRERGPYSDEPAAVGLREPR